MQRLCELLKPPLRPAPACTRAAGPSCQPTHAPAKVAPPPPPLHASGSRWATLMATPWSSWARRARCSTCRGTTTARWVSADCTCCSIRAQIVWSSLGSFTALGSVSGCPMLGLLRSRGRQSMLGAATLPCAACLCCVCLLPCRVLPALRRTGHSARSHHSSVGQATRHTWVQAPLLQASPALGANMACQPASPLQMIYCNAEGIQWVDHFRIVVTSDKAKSRQPYWCAGWLAGWPGPAAAA